MATWYCARKGTWRNNIEPIEIDRATDSFIVLKGGRRQAKSCYYESFFPTFEEAKQFLISHQQRQIEHARSSLEDLKKLLIHYLGLTEGEPESQAQGAGDQT